MDELLIKNNSTMIKIKNQIKFCSKHCHKIFAFYYFYIITYASTLIFIAQMLKKRMVKM